MSNDAPGATPRFENRRSDRTMPLVSEEEAVLIHSGNRRAALAKLMDLSDTGVLVYLIDGDIEPSPEPNLSLFHKGKIFQIRSKLVRREHRLAGFEFIFTSTAQNQIRTKLIHMERDWIRLSGNTPS